MPSLRVANERQRARLMRDKEPSQFGCRYGRQARLGAAGVALSSFLLMPIASAEQWLNVTLPPAMKSETAGRLLVFAEAVAAGQDAQSVDASVLHPTQVAVAGHDVRTFGLDRSVAVDLDRDASPLGFSKLPPGDYRVQAVLDPHGDYGHNGREAGDLVSGVITLHLPLAEGAALALDHALPTTDVWSPADASPAERARLASARTQLTDFTVASPTLS